MMVAVEMVVAARGAAVMGVEDMAEAVRAAGLA